MEPVIVGQILCLVALLVVIVLLVMVLRQRSASAAPQDTRELQAGIDYQNHVLQTINEMCYQNQQLINSGTAGIRTSIEASERALGQLRNVNYENMSNLRNGVKQDLQTSSHQATESMESFAQRVASSFSQQSTQLTQTVEQLDKRFAAFQQIMNDTLSKNADAIAANLEAGTNRATAAIQEVSGTVNDQLKQLRTENTEQLEQMRVTVDEKLQTTLESRITRSFNQVNDQLEKVYKGLGEMQGLAQGVGDLKKVLSNVKTRGIVGEIQLGAILKEILSPEQYEENIPTVPGSSERVEFAVRLPGEDGSCTYLPIDSKFPGDSYLHVREALDAGDPEAAEIAWKQLEATLRNEARSIHEKYVAPPATTDFSILFLPFEGLYAEVVNRRGLLEALQRDYRVNVAGPSTMAALLNSLQMGFQTVAIQRHAHEIQKTLSAVKHEFGRYQELLGKAQKQLGTASKTLDSLAGTRMRAINRALRDVTEMSDTSEAARILGLPGSDADDTDDALYE